MQCPLSHEKALVVGDHRLARLGHQVHIFPKHFLDDANSDFVFADDAAVQGETGMCENGLNIDHFAIAGGIIFSRPRCKPLREAMANQSNIDLKL